MSKESKLGLSVLVVAMLATAAVAEMANSYTINTTANKTMGTYLVNQTGFTLYYSRWTPAMEQALAPAVV